MFYVINSSNTVLFRSNSKERMEAKASIINTRGFGAVIVTETKPQKLVDRNLSINLLSYNDSVEIY